ncbi:MAG: phenylalanine--tRNA ligase subunit beta [Deltaproteobacteria bacterium]|nr:phenylalanine--tRNA ligase subunit beta [Deltaproteobacteria bacterium]
MQLSYKWLSEYVESPPEVETAAQRLTEIGHAVEQADRMGDDTILDIDITTNRPDCMNHLGMAREIAVAFDRPWRPPEVQLQETSEAAAALARIEIEDPALCRRYVARVIRGVAVGASPPWLRERLESLGLRSINNVVDVTNFVLWEYGQPLHAFDLSKIGEATIQVRLARAGETLVTLDGESRDLNEETLIIADAHGPIALAGVMGGRDSEVSVETQDILLESAFFAPSSVRTTASRLGLHTDASHRFERGADPEVCREAADRAAALIAELGGGEILQGAIDIYPAPYQRKVIPLDPERLTAFAGAPIPRPEMERWLGGLGLAVESDGSDGWEVTVPSWRHLDLDLPADLYEEVIRLYGIDRIDATLPALSGADGHTPQEQGRARRMRDVLVSCGCVEAVNFAFHDAQSDASFPGLYQAVPALELSNPLSERYSVMRRSLLPNLIEAARFNQRRGAGEIRLFEVGHIFAQHGEAGEESQEKDALGLVVGGQTGTPWENGRPLDFFDLKGILESLGVALDEELTLVPASRSGLSDDCAAEIRCGSRQAGYCGLLEEGEGPFPLFVAEIDVETLGTGVRRDTISEPSRFPGIQADLTLTHSVQVSWGDLRQAIEAVSPDDLASFHLKDRYQGKGVPAGAVNTTLTFVYTSSDRSLTQDEVNDRQGLVAEALNSRFAWPA